MKQDTVEQLAEISKMLREISEKHGFNQVALLTVKYAAEENYKGFRAGIIIGAILSLSVVLLMLLFT